MIKTSPPGNNAKRALLVLGGVLGVDFVVVGGFVVDACIGVLLYEVALLARPQQLVGVGVITTKLLKQILCVLVGKRVGQILQPPIR